VEFAWLVTMAVIFALFEIFYSNFYMYNVYVLHMTQTVLQALVFRFWFSLMKSSQLW